MVHGGGMQGFSLDTPCSYAGIAWGDSSRVTSPAHLLAGTSRDTRPVSHPSGNSRAVFNKDLQSMD